MAEALTMIGTTFVIFGVLLLILNAQNRRPWTRVRRAVLDETRRQRLEALADDTRTRRN